MRRSDISFSLLVSLLACGDSSIGADTCTGAHTSCAETRLVQESEQLPAGGRTGELDGAELTDIEPRWQRALGVAAAQQALPDQYSFSAQGMLLGNGTAGLWYVNLQSSTAGIEVYKLDDDGEPVDSLLIEPPPSELLTVPGQGKPEIEGEASFINDNGPAPILSLGWSNRACKNQKGCPSVVETVALDHDPHERPLRIADYFWVHAARSQDGGLWTFGAELRKHDARGKLEIQQTLFSQRATALPMRGGIGHSIASEAQLATTKSQRLWVYAFNKDGCPDLWRLDEWGNLDRHFALNLSCQGQLLVDQGPAVVAVDRYDRVVGFNQTRYGDLYAYRVDVESDDRNDWVGDWYRVRRDDYTPLGPHSVSEDRAGNLYVVSLSGTRDAPVPMLCKLPLDGDLSCFTWRSLPAGIFVNSVQAIGGAEDVLYLYYVVEQGSVTREMLARFDFSCALAAKSEGGAEVDVPPSGCAAESEAAAR